MPVKPTMSWICGVALILLISSITAIESKTKGRIEDDASKPKILFVSVLFRHGDRTPDNLKSELYPKDPHINNTFYPMGLGGLTNAGEIKMYKFGSALRKRYNNFLGDLYMPGDVEARSSDYLRTKTSLQLVLAGLYPPTGIQTWKKSLNWQPIATEYVPKNMDNLLAAPYSCPKYFEELMQVAALPDVNETLVEFHPDLEKLTKNTGKSMNNVLDMWLLYHGLKAEESMHLKLPKWTKNFFPKGPLLEAAKFVYRILNWNVLLKRLSGGVLLKRIIDDMKAVAVNGGLSTKPRKIHLFSGHDHNVAALLSALGLFKPHVPQYSSAVIIELIRRDKIHFVRIIRYLGTPSKFKVAKLPNCNKLCRLDTFIKQMRSVTPIHVERECESETISQARLDIMLGNFQQKTNIWDIERGRKGLQLTE